MNKTYRKGAVGAMMDESDHPGILAAGLSASHVERAPKKKTPPTPYIEWKKRSHRAAF